MLLRKEEEKQNINAYKELVLMGLYNIVLPTVLVILFFVITFALFKFVWQ